VHGLRQNRTSLLLRRRVCNGSYSIVACVFVAAGMCLPSRCLTMNIYSDFITPVFRRHVTISSHPCLGFPGRFPLGFTPKILYAFLIYLRVAKPWMRVWRCQQDWGRYRWTTSDRSHGPFLRGNPVTVCLSLPIDILRKESSPYEEERHLIGAMGDIVGGDHRTVSNVMEFLRGTVESYHRRV
jgi:hypothetical protein